MSTTKLVTVICWIIVAVVMVGLVIWFLTGSIFGISTGFKIGVPTFHIGSFDKLTGPYNPVGTYTVSAEGVQSIDVGWVAGELSITPYEGNVVKLTEYARRELKDQEKLVYKVSGDKLEIRYTAPGVTMNMVTKKLELLVPKSAAEHLDALKVGTSSANVKISDFSSRSFALNVTSGDSDLENLKSDTADIHSTSGRIDIQNMTAKQLVLGSTSGEIKLEGVTADFVKSNTTSGGQILGGMIKAADVSSTSGNIRLSGVTAGTLKANTTSGGQELGGTFKSVDAGSVSGAIRISSSVNPDTMKCETTSGSITVTIPGSNDLTVSYHTTSGRFNSDIPVRTGGSAAYRFSTVSGSIWLKAA